MNEYIDLWDKNWLYQWVNKHCKSREVLDKERDEALQVATLIIKQKLDGVEITTEPITFYASEFPTDFSFALAMKNTSNMFKDSEDIIVRYSKPENKETKEIEICFQVLRSKSKLFYNYMLETEHIFAFSLSSGNEIKHCIKLLNSLGVKNEDGENLSSKEKDTTKEIKDALATINGGKTYCEVKLDKERNIIILDWYISTDKQDNTPNFAVVNDKINDILK